MNGNYVKTEMAVPKVGYYCEKIVKMSDNKRMRIKITGRPTNRFHGGDRQAQHLVQNHGNIGKCGMPDRLMYYGLDGSWVDYPIEVTSLVKRSFKEGKGTVEVIVRGQNCLIDLYRMLEVEFGSWHETSIAWIDVNGKCFFPNFCVNSRNGDNSGHQEIGVEVMVLDNDSSSVNNQQRKRRENDEEVNQVLKIN